MSEGYLGKRNPTAKDLYETPRGDVRLLLDHQEKHSGAFSGCLDLKVLDAGCGLGAISDEIEAWVQEHDYLYESVDIRGIDVRPVADQFLKPGRKFVQGDFLDPSVISEAWPGWGPNLVISNPPYAKAAFPFFKRAYEVSMEMVAMYLKASWVCSIRRREWLNKHLSDILYLPGHRNLYPEGFDGKKGQGQIDYAWYVSQKNHYGDPNCSFHGYIL